MTAASNSSIDEQQWSAWVAVVERKARRRRLIYSLSGESGPTNIVAVAARFYAKTRDVGFGTALVLGIAKLRSMARARG